MSIEVIKQKLFFYVFSVFKNIIVKLLEGSSWDGGIYGFNKSDIIQVIVVTDIP